MPEEVHIGSLNRGPDLGFFVFGRFGKIVESFLAFASSSSRASTRADCSAKRAGCSAIKAHSSEISLSCCPGKNNRDVNKLAGHQFGGVSGYDNSKTLRLQVGCCGATLGF